MNTLIIITHAACCSRSLWLILLNSTEGAELILSGISCSSNNNIQEGRAEENRIMFFEVEMTRNVIVSPDKLHTGLLLKRSIILQLLEDVKRINATEEHGFLIAVTTLEGQGEGKIREMMGSVVFPVKFKCIVFKPFKNEILEGEVIEVMKSGLRVICGPMTELFIPYQAMKDFSFVPGENPVFKGKVSHQIEKGGKIRFKILGIKWVEQRRMFQALGTLQGNYLGPISDPENLSKVAHEINSDVQLDNPEGSPTKTNDNPQGTSNGWATGTTGNHQGSSAGPSDNAQGWGVKRSDSLQGQAAGKGDNPMEVDAGPKDNPQGWDAGTSADPMELDAGTKDHPQGLAVGMSNSPMELDAGIKDKSQGWAPGTSDNPLDLDAGPKDKPNVWALGTSDNPVDLDAEEPEENPQG